MNLEHFLHVAPKVYLWGACIVWTVTPLVVGIRYRKSTNEPEAEFGIGLLIGLLWPFFLWGVVLFGIGAFLGDAFRLLRVLLRVMRTSREKRIDEDKPETGKEEAE